MMAAAGKPMTGSLFPDLAPTSPLRRQRRRGHAAIPGTGPKGETCGTCAHLARHRMAKTYLKCDLIRWTSGPGTDVRAKDPACSRWERRGG
jgi:hypothetical protein